MCCISYSWIYKIRYDLCQPLLLSLDRWFKGIKLCSKLSDRRSKKPVKIDAFGSPICRAFIFKMVHSGALYIFERRRGPPNVAEPGVALCMRLNVMTIKGRNFVTELRSILCKCNVKYIFSLSLSLVDKVREANGCVLIHCLAGISRSPTVAIAYVMHVLGMTCDDAYRSVFRV